jgi:hypothetical protein
MRDATQQLCKAFEHGEPFDKADLAVALFQVPVSVSEEALMYLVSLGRIAKLPQGKFALINANAADKTPGMSCIGRVSDSLMMGAVSLVMHVRMAFMWLHVLVAKDAVANRFNKGKKLTPLAMRAQCMILFAKCEPCSQVSDLLLKLGGGGELLQKA